MEVVVVVVLYELIGAKKLNYSVFAAFFLLSSSESLPLFFRLFLAAVEELELVVVVVVVAGAFNSYNLVRKMELVRLTTT